MKSPKKRTIKAWGVLSSEVWVGSIKLCPVGNGKQFQYPIFFTKKDAFEYRKECHGVWKIVRLTITYNA